MREFAWGQKGLTEVCYTVNSAKKLNLNHMVANNLFCVLSSWAEQDGKRFAEDIKSLNNHQLYEYLNDCIEFEWNEGVLICEKEIERRGLHIDDPKERFEL